MSELEHQFLSLLEELSTKLTELQVEDARELVNANELGVAFENFCTSSTSGMPSARGDNMIENIEEATVAGSMQRWLPDYEPLVKDTC